MSLKKGSLRLFVLSLFCAVFWCTTTLNSSAAATNTTVPGELIIRWHANSPTHLIISPFRPLLNRQPIGGQTEVVKLPGSPDTITTRQLMRRIEQRTDVRYVETNGYVTASRQPSDPMYGPVQWHLPRIKADKAWDITTGSPSIVVAVIDTGIINQHPDLSGRVLQGFDFISDLDSSGDGDGWDNDPTDEFTNDRGEDTNYHGTHVAGIIGAASNNGIGITGTDWNCRILPIRVLGVESARGNEANMAAAIRWAAGIAIDNTPQNTTPAQIINLSTSAPKASKVLEDAVKEAIAKGSIVVAAAGNDDQDMANVSKEGQSCDANNVCTPKTLTGPIYPASIPGVIAVGASGYESKRASYSNFGRRIDIMAPGGSREHILPTAYNGEQSDAGITSTLFIYSSKTYTYASFEGTSAATPIVAGVIALMLSVNPTLKLQEVLYILQQTADPQGRCTEGCGAGLIDAQRAVRAAKDPSSIDDPDFGPAGNDGPDEARIVGGCAMPEATELPSPLIILGVIGALVFRRRS